jgi:hypothetical protein
MKYAPYLLCTAMAASVPTSTGCQQMLSKAAKFAATVLPYITEAAAVLDAVDLQAKQYFKLNPNPDLEKKYVKAMAKARLSLSAASRTAEGTGELAQADVQSGFDQFEKAFQEIMTLLGPLGVVRVVGDGTLQAGAGDDAVVVKLPRALSYVPPAGDE